MLQITDSQNLSSNEGSKEDTQLSPGKEEKVNFSGRLRTGGERNKKNQVVEERVGSKSLGETTGIGEVWERKVEI